MPDKPYNFDPAFEAAIIWKLISDPSLVPRLAPHFKPERLKDGDARLLAESILGVYRRTGVVATRTVALQDIRMRIDSGAVTADRLTSCARFLEDSEESVPPADSAYIREVVLGEARKEAVWQALDSGLKLFKSGHYDRISDIVSKAAGIGRVDVAPGQDAADSLQGRTTRRRQGDTKQRFPTGIPELDEALRGGLGQGELGCILGAPKFGKSMALTQFSFVSASVGKTVVYLSLEMGEDEILERIDAATSRVPINALSSKADYVHEVTTEWWDKVKPSGRIHVKQFPSYETTTRDLDEYLQSIRAERSITPDMLIVDSGDLCGSTRKADGRYEELGSVYSELRGIGVKWNVPVWTASWANRESLSKKVVTMGDVAESFKKVAIADVGVAICGTEEERKAHMIRLYLAFCRFATAGATIENLRNGFEYGMLTSPYSMDFDRVDEQV